jgi:hypothetical protein
MWPAIAGMLVKNSSASSMEMLEDVGDRLALVVHLERLAVVAPSVHTSHGHVDVRQEVHLDLERPVAAAGLAPPALDVEGEPAGLVPADLGLLRAGVELADVVEHPGVGRRVGARRPPDRRLVDDDHLVDVVEAVDALVPARQLPGAVDVAHQRTGEDVVDERSTCPIPTRRSRR